MPYTFDNFPHSWWHDRCGRRLAYSVLGGSKHHGPARLWCVFCDQYPPSFWVTQGDDAIEATYKLGGSPAVQEMLRMRVEEGASTRREQQDESPSQERQEARTWPDVRRVRCR